MTRYAVLDIETTGLSPQDDRIVEIGVLYINENGHEERYAGSLLNPLREIPDAASAVHGISEQMVRDQPHFGQVAESLRKGLDGRVIVGHNVQSFDIAFLDAEFARHGVVWQVGEVIDTLSVARQLLIKEHSKSLANLCAALQIHDVSAHRTEGDVRATWELLCALRHAADQVPSKESAPKRQVSAIRKYQLPRGVAEVPQHLLRTA
jgi:DNA polymerase III epsilon subunit family exonuclease